WRKHTHEEWAKGEYELQKMYDDVKKTFYKDSGKVREALKDEPEKIVQLGLEKSVEDVLERQEKDKRRKWKKKKKLKEEEEE
ncbi:MAG: hypothetical protein GY950_02130, partial [bacterium]|nr:hypothetical protein [bacterium]